MTPEDEEGLANDLCKSLDICRDSLILIINKINKLTRESTDSSEKDRLVARLEQIKTIFEFLSHEKVNTLVESAEQERPKLTLVKT